MACISRSSDCCCISVKARHARKKGGVGGGGQAGVDAEQVACGTEERFGSPDQGGGGNPVHPLLVFLHLLKSHADAASKLGLIDAQRLPTRAHPGADLNVEVCRAAGGHAPTLTLAIGAAKPLDAA